MAFRPRELFCPEVYPFLRSFPPFFGWPERGNHLFARRGAFKGPLRRLPIHTPDRFRSYGSRAYQPREILTRQNLGLFILSHTKISYLTAPLVKVRRSSMPAIQIRPIGTADDDYVKQFLVEHWLSTKLVSRGKIYSADQLPGFIALQDDRRVGLLTYHIEGDQCEIVTLSSLAEGVGVGTALIDAVKSVAVSRKCRRLWLTTTNDNTSALRFYQRKGFVLAALHRNALDASRKLKPEIPSIGQDGIPIRDELELEMSL